MVVIFCDRRSEKQSANKRNPTNKKNLHKDMKVKQSFSIFYEYLSLNNDDSFHTY